jgi:hypothetical protein
MQIIYVRWWEALNDVVAKNIKAAENTFIFFLHENSSFDVPLFHEYIESVKSISVDNTDKKGIIEVIETNGYIIRCALYHFLADDMFIMKNFPENMGEYIEQIVEEDSRLIRLL